MLVVYILESFTLASYILTSLLWIEVVETYALWYGYMWCYNSSPHQGWVATDTSILLYYVVNNIFDRITVIFNNWTNWTNILLSNRLFQISLRMTKSTALSVIWCIIFIGSRFQIGISVYILYGCILGSARLEKSVQLYWCWIFIICTLLQLNLTLIIKHTHLLVRSVGA